MSQEILGKLQRVQRAAEGLYALMTSLRARAPVRADGYDSTRQVRVSIGADGLPTAIRSENGRYIDATVTDGDADWSLAE